MPSNKEKRLEQQRKRRASKVNEAPNVEAPHNEAPIEVPPFVKLEFSKVHGSSLTDAQFRKSMAACNRARDRKVVLISREVLKKLQRLV